MFPLGEALVSGAIGLGDGAVSANDAKAGRVDFTKQHATMLQAGVLGIGLILGLVKPGLLRKSVADELFTTPVALLARRAAFAQVAKGGSVPAYGYAAPRVAVSPHVGHLPAPRAAVRAPYLRQAAVPAI